MKEELDTQLIDVHLKSFEGENAIDNSNLVSLSVDSSTTYILGNIGLNEVILENIDTKITSVLDTKIDTQEAYWKLYSKDFYALYPDLFIRTDGMLPIDNLFAKLILGTISTKI